MKTTSIGLKTAIFGVVFFFFAASVVAQTPTPGYYMVYGSRDGSPIPVRLGQSIQIPLWGATPPASYDTVVFMHNPLSSANAVISERLGGTFPDTLVGRWDDRSFTAPCPDTLPGWTNQSMLGYAYLNEPRDPQNFFCTNGDTALICTYTMRVSSDTSLLGDTLYPFNSGRDQVSGPGFWADLNGLQDIIPLASFSPLVVISATCNYIPGDIGGNRVVNGIDVGYAVNYLKGGPSPPWYCDMCPQTPPFYASGDVNGNCVFNGIDIAYFVNYLKGVVPALLYCPSCPPSPW